MGKTEVHFLRFHTLDSPIKVNHMVLLTLFSRKINSKCALLINATTWLNLIGEPMVQILRNRTKVLSIINMSSTFRNWKFIKILLNQMSKTTKKTLNPKIFGVDYGSSTRLVRPATWILFLNSILPEIITSVTSLIKSSV